MIDVDDRSRKFTQVSRKGFWRILNRILWVLSVIAMGSLLGLIVANRLIVRQIEVYGEGRMTQVSVLLDLLDDHLPYLATSMAAVSVLLLLALVSTLMVHPVPRGIRMAGIGLVVVILIGSGLWMVMGRGSTIDTPPPLEATPTPVLP